MSTKAAYIYHHTMADVILGPGHPMQPARLAITHELLSASGILDQLLCVEPQPATKAQLQALHDKDYVDFLFRAASPIADKDQKCVYLCMEALFMFPDLYKYYALCAGGTLTAARLLIRGEAKIAINWGGGLHHGKKDWAHGFCFVNDIVLGIIELLKFYDRVLYIDIDVHHGDGVEAAFNNTDRVFTISFHQFGNEFFPRTGRLEDCGEEEGQGFAVNVPLKPGIADEAYRNMFTPIMERVMAVFNPNAVVLQCGTDSIANDRLGSLNLSAKGHAECVAFICNFKLPTMILGGGGYTVQNVARLWFLKTAVATGLDGQLTEKLPANKYYNFFGTGKLNVPSDATVKDQNTAEELELIRSKILARYDSGTGQEAMS
ncbi:hypothetical protein PhCBS80983_g06260 [Powellomyces hirtus]|uniref:Histone deacetylase n=1 Tax=Powellomyces hirtus TaxID=109895 RepID=A0A507DPP1_9FUNG|nr:hypothetical protein PhCBS80983_g06260 [Powellomyces hirtus]